MPRLVRKGIKILVTVAIPTFNGEKYISEVLEMVFGQDTDFSFEVLVIDSGSEDKTIRLIKQFPARLIQIPNQEFGHGKTRNFAVKMAKGKYVAFLTQDATPATKDWLRHLVNAFKLDPTVAAAYGSHLPRPDADPKTKKDLLEFFGAMGPSDKPTLHRKGDPVFFSDVNSCISKEVWKKIPYQDLPYAEDQAFGKDILDAGYIKVFEPRAAVLHSHSYPPLGYFRRLFDEWMGLKISIGEVYPHPLWKALGGAVRGTFRDARYILGLPDLTFRERLNALYLAAGMNFGRRVAGYLAAREHLLPPWLKGRLSYERQRKAL